MSDLSEKIKKAFDEGSFLEVVQGRGLCKSPEQKLMLGISLFKLGRTHEALKILEGIAEKARKLTKAFYYLALLYRDLGEEDTAKDNLQKYLAFNPNDDEACDLLDSPYNGTETLLKEPSVQLAKIYAQQGHYEQALDIYSQVDKKTGLDTGAFEDALQVQNMYIMKTLQGWLEKVAR
jgi:tetratricopeptide (TPR) repeat protein